MGIGSSEPVGTKVLNWCMYKHVYGRYTAAHMCMCVYIALDSAYNIQPTPLTYHLGRTNSNIITSIPLVQYAVVITTSTSTRH